MLHKNPTVGKYGFLRFHVVRIGRNVDGSQPFIPDVRQEQRKAARSIRACSSRLVFVVGILSAIS
jgi:hypothetical protein